MTKDAQKLLRHIIDGAKSQNSATVEIDISKVDNIRGFWHDGGYLTMPN